MAPAVASCRAILLRGLISGGPAPTLPTVLPLPVLAGRIAVATCWPTVLPEEALEVVELPDDTDCCCKRWVMDLALLELSWRLKPGLAGC